MTRRLFNFVPTISAILIFATALTFVVGERPKIPLVTPSTTLHPTSADVQVQLTVDVFGKHGYSPCEGHVVLLKLRSDQTGQAKQVKIEEKEGGGGFTLPGLEPKTEYLIQVACKALNSDGLSHVGDFTQPIVIRTSDFDEPKEHDHEETEGSGNISSMNLFLITLCGLVCFTITTKTRTL